MDILKEQILRAKELMGLNEQKKAASSLDSEGNETFSWTEGGEDNVIFKSATSKPTWWWRVGLTNPDAPKDRGRRYLAIFVCDDCNDTTKTNLDNYKVFRSPHDSYEEAYTLLGKQLKMDLNDYIPE